MSAPVRPLVVDGRSWPRHGYLSPLDVHPDEVAPPTALWGGVVTDPAAVDAIAARVAFYARPWWRRWLSPRPTPAPAAAWARGQGRWSR